MTDAEDGMKELSLWKILFFALVVFPVAVFVFFVFIIPLSSFFWSAPSSGRACSPAPSAG
ncbi:MAG: hypothetical protein J6A21_02790 [Lentisphaeria bacterium]|nr:hypothetical protein [Lentisphaeria bacterium]